MENVFGFGTLEGDEALVVHDGVIDLRIGGEGGVELGEVLGEVVVVFCSVGGIGDDVEGIVGVFGDDEIVNDAAFFVEKD